MPKYNGYFREKYIGRTKSTVYMLGQIAKQAVNDPDARITQDDLDFARDLMEQADNMIATIDGYRGDPSQYSWDNAFLSEYKEARHLYSVMTRLHTPDPA